MPKVAFSTLGCKVNQFDTEVIMGLFRQKGYEIVDFDKTADVYIVNTCSVTHLGERKSRHLIRRAHRLNPDAVIAVTGCYAQVSPDEVKEIEGVDVIIGTQDRQRIVELVEEAIDKQCKVEAVSDIMKANAFEDIPLLQMPGRTRAFLKIQEGCTNFCTYCIIPYTRGPLRSRPIDSVVAETTKLVSAGFKEIVLTGIHLGAYGVDLGGSTNLVDAVENVLAVSGVERLRLGSLESIEVPDRLIKIMEDDHRMCRHLHLPLQSGDDRILAAMNRQYKVSEYVELVEGIKRRLPDIAVSTDVIVGFPGETVDMFSQSLAVIDSLDFARVHVFPYSRRTGTPAANYANQIAESEKKRRVQDMQHLAHKKTKEFNLRFIGQTLGVLFETENKGIIEGLTGNYIRVFAEGHPDMVGMIRNVRLLREYKDGLWGVVL